MTDAQLKTAVAEYLRALDCQDTVWAGPSRATVSRPVAWAGHTDLVAVVVWPYRVLSTGLEKRVIAKVYTGGHILLDTPENAESRKRSAPY